MITQEQRAIIDAAPRTHLGLAAKAALQEVTRLGSSEVDRLNEEVERWIDRFNEAYRELGRMRGLLDDAAAKTGLAVAEAARSEELLRAQCDERNRLAAELAAATAPHPDLERLQSLERAALEVRDGQTFTTYGREVHGRIMSHLAPHLPPDAASRPTRNLR